MNARVAKSNRRRWWRVALLLLVAAALDYQLYPSLTRVGGTSFNHSENGIWLRYTWYFGKWDAADLRALSARLRDEEIKYAYFHVRSIREDGSLEYRYPEQAKRLTSGLHKAAPGVKVIAWVYAGNRRGLGRVDPSKASVRAGIVKELLWLVNNCGFDGVQIDYEICPSGDAGFLQLMQDVRKVFPKDKHLSVATPMWVPGPFQGIGGWSADYFSQVAANCDQVCVMCYDSATYFPRAYVTLLRWQVPEVTWAVSRSDPRCGVIFGIPSYGPGVRAHNPHAENVRLALKGIREGADDPRAVLANCTGVAIFADYTTQPDEWRDYERLWLRKP